MPMLAAALLRRGWQIAGFLDSLMQLEWAGRGSSKQDAARVAVRGRPSLLSVLGHPRHEDMAISRPGCGRGCRIRGFPSSRSRRGAKQPNSGDHTHPSAAKEDPAQFDPRQHHDSPDRAPQPRAPSRLSDSASTHARAGLQTLAQIDSIERQLQLYLHKSSPSSSLAPCFCTSSPSTRKLLSLTFPISFHLPCLRPGRVTQSIGGSSHGQAQEHPVSRPPHRDQLPYAS